MIGSGGEFLSSFVLLPDNVLRPSAAPFKRSYYLIQEEKLLLGF